MLSIFLKIVLNCGKENMLILNTYSFQKKMLSNLTRVLIYSLTKFVFEDAFKDSWNARCDFNQEYVWIIQILTSIITPIQL